MTLTSILSVGLLLLGAGFAAFVRLAPNDPARWHVDIGSGLVASAGSCADHVVVAVGSARAVCVLADTPTAALGRLDAAAMATPRTTRLAGDPASGRITWITRSQLWGFPDYTTAQSQQTPTGTRLEIFARLRFGQSDMGVNGTRLRGWLSAL